VAHQDRARRRVFTSGPLRFVAIAVNRYPLLLRAQI
jgi:hypothetical protein